MPSTSALLLHGLHIIAILTFLADIPLPTTAILLDETRSMEYEGEEDGYASPNSTDCRYILARLPTNLTSHTHPPAHYLTPFHPFHPGSHFRHRSCQLDNYMTQDHVTGAHRFPSVSPMLREHDAFAVWGAVRVVAERIVHTCIDPLVSGVAGGFVGLEAWREFDGEMLLTVHGVRGGVADAEANATNEHYSPYACMSHYYELDG